VKAKRRQTKLQREMPGAPGVLDLKPTDSPLLGRGWSQVRGRNNNHNQCFLCDGPHVPLLVCPLLSGTMRPVQRNFYEPSSAPGKGVVWEWENDNDSWTPYDMEICVTIQNAYEKQHPWLDLTSLGFCYLIDFNSMCQTNRQSQRKRRLRRRMDLAFPLIMGSIPKSKSWPVGASAGQPCSCQQCILVNSTRAASNAILASQRRKLYGGTAGNPGAAGTLAVVRQSNTFAGTSLWSPTSASSGPNNINISMGGGQAKAEQVQLPLPSANFPCSPMMPSLSSTHGHHKLNVNGQNNLNRPGTQRISMGTARGAIPQG